MDCVSDNKKYLVPFPAAGGRYPTSIGMMKYVLEKLETENIEDIQIHASGVSSGAACAIFFIIGMIKGYGFEYFDKLHDEFLEIINDINKDEKDYYIRNNSFFDAVEMLIKKYVENIDDINGKVHIGYCRMCENNGMKFEIVSHFSDIDDLVGAFRASAHYPILLKRESHYEYRGHKCVDGVFMHKNITLPEYNNIMFCEEVNNTKMDLMLVASKDKYEKLLNIGYEQQKEKGLQLHNVDDRPIDVNAKASTAWNAYKFMSNLLYNVANAISETETEYITKK